MIIMILVLPLSWLLLSLLILLIFCSVAGVPARPPGGAGAPPDAHHARGLHTKWCQKTSQLIKHTALISSTTWQIEHIHRNIQVYTHINRNVQNILYTYNHHTQWWIPNVDNNDITPEAFAIGLGALPRRLPGELHARHVSVDWLDLDIV